MSGMPHYNVGAFATANAICKEHGAAYVYNPAIEWLHERPAKEPRTHEDYMRDCIHELTKLGAWPSAPLYDYVVQLDGWAESDGARLEYTVARACGIPTIDLCDVEDGG